jgi:hypothetical protein
LHGRTPAGAIHLRTSETCQPPQRLGSAWLVFLRSSELVERPQFCRL